MWYSERERFGLRAANSNELLKIEEGINLYHIQLYYIKKKKQIKFEPSFLNHYLKLFY